MFIGSTVVYRTLSQLNEVKMTLCEQFPEYHVETHNPQPLTSVVTQVTDDMPTIYLVGNLQPVPELPPNWALGEVAVNLSPHIKALVTLLSYSLYILYYSSLGMLKLLKDLHCY